MQIVNQAADDRIVDKGHNTADRRKNNYFIKPPQHYAPITISPLPLIISNIPISLQ